MGAQAFFCASFRLSSSKAVFLWLILASCSVVGPAPTYKPELNHRFADANGKEISLSDFAGKPVLLNFWASWCPECVMELPLLERIRSLYSERELAVIAVCTEDSLEHYDRFVKSNHYSFPLLFDKHSIAKLKFNVTSLPQSVLLDQSGNTVSVMDRRSGTLQTQMEGLRGRWPALKEAIEGVLKDRNGPT